MTSIRHFPASDPLPDWRNFGVILRLLLGVNLLALCAALVQSPRIEDCLPRYVEMSAFVEPLLLLAIALLAALRNGLRRLPMRLGQLAVLGLVVGLAHAQYSFWHFLGLTEPAGALRVDLLTLLTSSTLLAYFELRASALSPAQAEARLAALNARIRPHFLFNSLNAALSLIRARPQQAEAALESLADLFRAAMRDPADLVKLSAEIALCRQYLDLEKLRLGERLAVDWQIEAIPVDTPIPPLMLQPLLENAVYHGIEPMAEGGTMAITVSRRGEEVCIAVRNPTAPERPAPPGNHLALANIRERLALYYDLEARLEIAATGNSYQVSIILPCRGHKA
jgi:two-component system sensor histidine kinase AlgZ